MPNPSGEYQIEECVVGADTLNIHGARRHRAHGFSGAVSALVLTEDAAREASRVQAFGEAVVVFARVRHPHVVSIEDVFVAEGRSWAVVPRLDGAPLSQLLEVPAASARPLPAPEAIGIVASVAAAVQALSEGGLGAALGGLSPDSIWMLPAGTPLLLPTVRATPRASASTSARGVFARYVAPEASSGVALQPSADVYALGLLLWDLLTLGRARVPVALADVTSVTPIAVDAGLAQLVMRSLSASPGDRPHDACEFGDELSRVVLLPGVARADDGQDDESVTVKLYTSEPRAAFAGGPSRVVGGPPLAVARAPVRRADAPALPPDPTPATGPRGGAWVRDVPLRALLPAPVWPCPERASRSLSWASPRMAAAVPEAGRPRRLRIVRGEGAPGSSLPLAGPLGRWIVGRARSADLVVGDPDMSREHFEIVAEPDGQFRVHDLGSKNGLFVNGAETDEQALRPGDELRAGETLLRFER